MPTLRTPLVGSYNNRSFTATVKDQFVKGATVTVIGNKQTRSASYYTEKRVGLGAGTTIASGSRGVGCFYSQSTSRLFSVFSDSGNQVSLFYEQSFVGTVSCGILSASNFGPIVMFSETILNDITYLMIWINSTSDRGWFLASDATSTALAQTGTTHSNTTVDGITSTAGYYVGQAYSGSGIPANTRIAAVNSANAITLTLAATTSVTATFTREAVAKIIDADFPTDSVGGFAELDGYMLIATASGRAYVSDLNTVVSWGASNYLTLSKYADAGAGLLKYGDGIAALSGASIEFLYNAGNPAGSPFSSDSNAFGSPVIGAIGSAAMTVVNGVPHWLGKDQNIYTLVGKTPKKVSTLAATSPTPINPSLFVLTGFTFNRKDYLCIAFPLLITGNTFWCSIDDDYQFSEPNFGAVSAYGTSTGVSGYFVLSDTVGKTYLMSATSIIGAWSFLDNGAAFTMSIQLATDMGTQERKFVDELRLVGDAQASGSLDISYSDDDGANYSTPRSMPLTSIAEMRLSRWGTFEGTRLWKFEHSANTAFRAKLVEIDYTITK